MLWSLRLLPFLTLDVVVVFELVSPGSKGCRAFQSSLILVCVDYFEKGKNTSFLGSPQVIVYFLSSVLSVFAKCC